MDKFKFELFGRLKKHEDMPDTTQGTPGIVQSGAFQGGVAFRMPQSTAAGQQNVPTALVSQMVSQGLGEADIIKELKLKGYSFSQIDQALNSVLKSSVNNRPVPPAPQYQAQSYQKQPAQTAQVIDESQAYPHFNENIDAHIETIVEERLDSFKSEISNIEKDMEKIHDQIENLDVSMKQLEQRVQDTVDGISRKFDALEAKFEEVEPKISSIEKAFKDVIPNLIDNVREITEIVRKHKSGSISSALPSDENDERGKKKEDE